MLKKNILGTLIFALLFGLNGTFFFPLIYRSHIKLQKLALEEKILNDKINKLQVKIESFNKKISLMEEEFEREKIARNRLQMVKENEEIYRFINKK